MSGTASLYSSGIPPSSTRRTTDTSVSITLSRQSISLGRASTDIVARPLPVLLGNNQNRNESISFVRLFELIHQDVFETEPPPPYN